MARKNWTRKYKWWLPGSTIHTHNEKREEVFYFQLSQREIDMLRSILNPEEGEINA